MNWRGYVIIALDWVHAKVLRHRPYWTCEKVAWHPWWDFVTDESRDDLDRYYGRGQYDRSID